MFFFVVHHPLDVQATVSVRFLLFPFFFLKNLRADLNEHSQVHLKRVRHLQVDLREFSQ
jgi:hypothetical protein